MARPGSPFQLNPQETFTTFLYGGSMSVLVSLKFEDGAKKVVLGIALVLYVLIDWMSRVPLPQRLPEAARYNKELPLRLGKSVLEAAGIFCLAVAFASCLRSDSSCGVNFNAFAFFLFFTTLWNWLSMEVMLDFNQNDLIGMMFSGRGMDSRIVREYAAPLTLVYNALNRNIDAHLTTGRTKGRTAEATLIEARSAFRVLALKGTLRWLFQSFVNHLAWTGIAVAILLLLKTHSEEASNGFHWLRECVNVKEVLASPWSLLGFCLLSVFGVWVLYIPANLFGDRPDGAELRRLARQPSLFLFFVLAGFFLTRWVWTETSATPVFLLGAVCAIPPALLFMISELTYTAKRYRTTRALKVLASVTLISLLSLSYLFLQPAQLMLFIVLQQVTVTLFLYFVASWNGPSHSTMQDPVDTPPGKSSDSPPGDEQAALE